MIFILAIGNTEVSQINGITAAGETEELIKFTPPADAEYLFYNRPRCINAIPVTPSGNPTPAIMTKASKILVGFPILVARAGSIVGPSLPYFFISDSPGKDIRTESGVPDIKEILEKSSIIADEIFRMDDEVMLAESIPGGTTTAMAILRDLGYISVSSSSMSQNPVALKLKVVEDALQRVGNLGRNEVLRELGDPVLAFLYGFTRRFRGKVYLAGGTQMLAVTALLKLDGLNYGTIVTTKYVVADKTATFSRTANEIGTTFVEAKVNLFISRYPGIREYEKGIVKEGVGAGGAYYLASTTGFTNKEIVDKIDNLYSDLIGE
ncbi:MAG: TIGR00303 family protein [Thermoplasmatales archaeon]|nr:TIGR00303 family protein [Thermoplasmatales archaeon]